jgi:hypothetical protein
MSHRRRGTVHAAATRDCHSAFPRRYDSCKSQLRHTPRQCSRVQIAQSVGQWARQPPTDSEHFKSNFRWNVATTGADSDFKAWSHAGVTGSATGPRPEGASAATVTVPAAPGPRAGGSGRATVTVTVTDSDRACQVAAESLTVTVRHRTRSVRLGVGRESRSESAAARRRGYSDPGPASRVTDALTVTSGRRR